MNPAIEVLLNANVAGVVKGFGTAGAAAGAFGDAVAGMAERVSRVAQRINQTITAVGTAMIATGAAIETAMVKSTSKAGDFESGMLNVQTIVQGTEAELATLSNQVQEMGPRFGQSSNLMAAGLYDIVSSGFAAQEAITVLEASSTAAAAGLTSTATASTAIVAGLNAYAMSAGQAADVADIYFSTVDKGVITFEQLAEGVGEWLGIAQAAGVQMDDASAALATMTTNGIQATESHVSLNRTIQAFINPSERMNALIKGLGYESGNAMLQQLGLRGSIVEVNKAANGEVAVLQDLFQNVNALQGVLALTAGGGQTYARIHGEITDESERAGAAQRAFAIQAQGLNFQLKELRESGRVFGATIGRYLLPPAKAITGFFQIWLDILNGLPGPVKAGISYLAAFGGGLMILGGFLVLTTWRVKLMTTALQFMFKAMSADTAARFARAMSGPLGMLRALGSTVVGNVPILQTFTTWLTSSQMAMGGFAAAIGGAIIGLTAYNIIQSNANRHAKEFVATLGENDDLSNMHGIRDAMREISVEIASLQDEADQSSWLALFQNLNPWMANTRDEALATIEALAEQEAVLQERLMNMSDNLVGVRNLTGLTNEEVYKLANTVGIDLTGSFDKVVPKMVEAYRATLNAANAMDSLEMRAAALKDQFEAISSAVGEFQDWGSTFDRISGTINDSQKATAKHAKSTLDAEQAAIAETRARRSLEDIIARTNEVKARSIELDIEEARLNRDEAILSEAEARQALADAEWSLHQVRDAGASPDEQARAEREVARARIDLARATGDIRDAQKNFDDVSTGKARAEELLDLELQRREAVLAISEAQERASTASQKAAEVFSGLIEKALPTLQEFATGLEAQNKAQLDWEKDLFAIVKRGAPMDVVQQLLEMGTKGAPIVKGLADASDREFNRIVDIMETSARTGTARYTQELQAGLYLAAQAAAAGGQLTADSFLDKIGTIPELIPFKLQEIIDVANKFGLQIQFTQAPAGSFIGTPFTGGGGGGGGGAPRLNVAHGHFNRGAGISNRAILWGEAGREAYIPLSERVPSRRTVGILSQTARELGFAVTRMAQGGIVMPSSSYSSAAASPTIIYVPVPERKVTEISIGAMVRQDIREVVRDSKRLARRSALTNAGVAPNA